VCVTNRGAGGCAHRGAAGLVDGDRDVDELDPQLGGVIEATSRQT